MAEKNHTLKADTDRWVKWAQERKRDYGDDFDRLATHLRLIWVALDNETKALERNKSLLQRALDQARYYGAQLDAYVRKMWG